MKNKNQKRAFTIAETAEYACVSRATVDNWLARGDLPFEEQPSAGKEIYKFRRIRKTDLDDFLNKFYSQPKTRDHNRKNSPTHKLFLQPRKS